MITQELETFMGILVRKGKLAKFDRGIVQEVRHTYYPEIVNIEEADLLIDVGAHIGSYGVWCRHLNPRLTVFAFEPFPANNEVCELNLAGSGAAWVVCSSRMLGYEELNDPVWLVNNQNSGDIRYMEREQAKKFDNGFSIQEIVKTQPLMTLEQLLSRPRPGSRIVMKLDCEGGEFDILLNAKEETLRKISVIVGEYHQGEKAFHEQIVARLSAWFELKAERKHDERLGNFVFVRK